MVNGRIASPAAWAAAGFSQAAVAAAATPAFSTERLFM